MRVASSSTEIKCHNWPDTSIISTYTPTTVPPHSIETISWGKDSGWMIIIPSIGIAELITLNDSAKHIHTFNDIENLSSASFQNTTKRFAALGTTTGFIKIMDLKTKTIKKTLPRAPSSILKMEYTHKDTHLVASCSTGQVKIYNPGTAMLTGSFMVPKTKTLTNFKCHPTQTSLIAACSEEGIVTIWDMHKSKPIVLSEHHAAPVTDVSFSPLHPNSLVCLGMDRRMSLLDYRTNKIEQDIKLETSPTAVDISSDGTAFVVGFQNGMLQAYDSRIIKNVLTHFSGHKTKINQVAFENACTEEPEMIAGECTEIMFEAPEVFKSPEVFASPDGQRSIGSATRDSFLDAMSLNSTNRSPFLVRIGNERSPKSFVRLRIPTDVSDVDNFVSPVGIERPLAKSHLENFMKSHKASTPVAPGMQDLGTPTVSPIPNNRFFPPSALSELKSFIKDTIRGEMDAMRSIAVETKDEINGLRSELEGLRNEMRDMEMEMKWLMNRRILDLNMYLVKQFMRLDDNFDYLKPGGEY